MKGQRLIIVFKDDLAFLTDEVALGLDQVKISDAPVKFKGPAFWEVEVINHRETENRLFVEVLSYQVGETEFPIHQIELTDVLCSIEKITFKSIDTNGLLRTLNNYEVPAKREKPQLGVYHETELPMQHPVIKQVAPVEQTYNEPFSIPIKDVRFLSGKVSFQKRIPQMKIKIEFEIINEHIIGEYDAIKNYFASVLKTKKFLVTPAITTMDGEITSVLATSKEIDKIDNTFIEKVKFKYVRAARRKESLIEKQLFTVEEYFQIFTDENNNSHQFFKDDNDFFEIMIEKSETKHYKHLRFLSSKHNVDICRLRLVHKPFSFVFLLLGSEEFHIIWETLDTQEATYIWSFDKDRIDLKQILEQTEITINQINKGGKNEYIRRNETNFSRVFHEYMDIHNGFRNWKEEIEKVILR